jgi:hypothetical protein
MIITKGNTITSGFASSCVRRNFNVIYIIFGISTFYPTIIALINVLRALISNLAPDPRNLRIGQTCACHPFTPSLGAAHHPRQIAMPPPQHLDVAAEPTGTTGMVSREEPPMLANHHGCSFHAACRSRTPRTNIMLRWPKTTHAHRSPHEAPLPPPTTRRNGGESLPPSAAARALLRYVL